MLLTACLIILGLSLLAAWTFRRHQRHQILQSFGYAAPPANLLLGNAWEVAPFQGFKAVETIERWMREIAKPIGQGKKGKIMGFYMGTQPVILSSSIEFIREWAAKDLVNFSDKGFAIFEEFPQLLNLKGDEWKRMRSIMTPVFSAAKLRGMSTGMLENARKMTKHLSKEIRQGRDKVDIFQSFRELTLAVIGQSALAMNIDCIGNPQDAMLKMVQDDCTQQAKLRSVLATIFPCLTYIMPGYKFAPNKTIMDHCHHIIESRRKSNSRSEKFVDALGLLMKASQSKDDDESLLTDLEIVSNTYIFLLAGYESTSTLLAFTAYHLAHNQEIQEKLFSEIKELEESSVSYETINGLSYLDQVLLETLRIHPSFPFMIHQLCKEERTIMGHKIPAGSVVGIPTWANHRDPEFWDEPERFDPDRFQDKSSLEDKPYLPFGLGYRNCPGKRFAFLEARLAMIELVTNFKLSLADPEQKLELNFKGFVLTTADEKMMIMLELREKIVEK